MVTFTPNRTISPTPRVPLPRWRLISSASVAASVATREITPSPRSSSSGARARHHASDSLHAQQGADVRSSPKSITASACCIGATRLVSSCTSRHPHTNPPHHTHAHTHTTHPHIHRGNTLTHGQMEADTHTHAHRKTLDHGSSPARKYLVSVAPRKTKSLYALDLHSAPG